MPASYVEGYHAEIFLRRVLNRLAYRPQTKDICDAATIVMDAIYRICVEAAHA